MHKSFIQNCAVYIFPENKLQTHSHLPYSARINTGEIKSWKKNVPFASISSLLQKILLYSWKYNLIIKLLLWSLRFNVLCMFTCCCLPRLLLHDFLKKITHNSTIPPEDLKGRGLITRKLFFLIDNTARNLCM